MQMTLRARRFLNQLTKELNIVEDDYYIPADEPYFDTKVCVPDWESDFQNVCPLDVNIVLRKPSGSEPKVVILASNVAFGELGNWQEFRQEITNSLTGSQYMTEDAYELLATFISFYGK